MIETAYLIPGTETPVDDGVNGAQRCVIELQNGDKRVAILKRGALCDIAAEAFSAILLREWGLPVPDPFLVDEAQGFAFASADAKYPSLKRRVGLQQPELSNDPATHALACELAISFRTSPLAAAIDEAIGNIDRNFGNILWDGADEMWIDHDASFGNKVLTMVDANKLCIMSSLAGKEDAFKTSAIGQALALESGKTARALAKIPETLCADTLADFVSARIGTLAARILARFPQPVDLLSAT